MPEPARWLSGQLRARLEDGDGPDGVFFQRIEAAGEEIITWPEALARCRRAIPPEAAEAVPHGLIHHRPEPGWLEVAAVMHPHRGPDNRRGGVE